MTAKPIFAFEYVPQAEMVAEASATLTQWAMRSTEKPPRRWLTVALWTGVFLICLVGFQTIPQLGDFSAPAILLVLAFLMGIALSYVAQKLMYGQALSRLAEKVLEDGRIVLEIWPDRISETTQTGNRTTNMARIEQIGKISGGSLISAGAFGYFVPDVALPEGLSGASLRADIQRFVEACR